MAARLSRFSGYVFAVAISHLPIAGTLSAQTSPSTPPAPAQAATHDDPERQRALDLYHAGKYVRAMMLFEKVSADHPSDVAVKEGWAFCVMAYAATLNDPDLRQKSRVRARQLALEAKQLGDTSNLLEMLLELPEDGSEPSFSGRKEADEVMKAAEADFSRGDLDKARNGYLHALLLEPKNYEATVFMGDTYFKQQQQVSAGECFARAAEIKSQPGNCLPILGRLALDSGKERGSPREVHPRHRRRALQPAFLDRPEPMGRASQVEPSLGASGGQERHPGAGRSAHQHHAQFRLAQEARSNRCRLDGVRHEPGVVVRGQVQEGVSQSA